MSLRCGVLKLLPAGAGVIPTSLRRPLCLVPAPRRRGGDPFGIVPLSFILDCSPQARG